MNTTLTPLRKAKGVVLVLTALSLLVILGMAGLAIDLGHSYSNKTRLQNSVDAAALAAAMKLLLDLQNNIGSATPVTTDAANAAGAAAHRANLTGFGSNWVTSPADITFCWSRDLQQFDGCESIESFSAVTPEVDTKFFVRASVASTALTNFIMQVMPGIGPTRSVGAVAVAGTSGTIYKCDVAPFFVCDNPDPVTGLTDDNCSDGACFGNPVTLTADPAVDSTHFFAIKTGSVNPPQTNTHDVTVRGGGPPVTTTYPCNDPINSPFETDGCVIIKDQRATNIDSTPLDTTDPDPVNEADANGFSVAIMRDLDDWSFNKTITFNGNFGYLQLVDSNGQDTDPGADAMKKNVLDSNACIANQKVETQPGDITGLDQAFNGLFGDSKPPFSTGSKMPDDIATYADHVGNGLSTPPNLYQPISYNFYSRIYAAKGWTDTNADHKFHQRLKNVPVLKCPNPTMSGAVKYDDLPVVGYACFFLNREMYETPQDGRLKNNEDFFITEHVDNSLCPPVIGLGMGVPNNILDARVILYQYYNSADS